MRSAGEKPITSLYTLYRERIRHPLGKGGRDAEPVNGIDTEVGWEIGKP